IGEKQAAPHPMHVTQRHNPGDLSLGIACRTCHGRENSREQGGPPGAGADKEEWRMPPRTVMAPGRGKARGELCGRWQKGVPVSWMGRGQNCADCTVAEFFVHHIGHDPLIAWAFEPGAGREPAPLDVPRLVELARAWAPILGQLRWCDTLTEEGSR